MGKISKAGNVRIYNNGLRILRLAMRSEIPSEVLLDTANLCKDRIDIGWSGYAPPHSKPGDTPAIDTGELAGAIYVDEISDTHVQVTAGHNNVADYAEHLEYGTSKMAARPFMLPAAEKTFADFNRLLGNKYQYIIDSKLEKF